jgi:hypothetical protein
MPDGLNKPYATTTIGHLVEIAAMLGIFWKDFDRDQHRYRAQGNGFSIEGQYTERLGVTFTFTKSGQTWFKENCVIYHEDIRELCFGFAPTIFRVEGEKQYTDEARGLGTLQLGSMTEIAQTLATFGCNTTTINYFRKERSRKPAGTYNMAPSRSATII